MKEGARCERIWKRLNDSLRTFKCERSSRDLILGSYCGSRDATFERTSARIRGSLTSALVEMCV